MGECVMTSEREIERKKRLDSTAVPGIVNEKLDNGV